MMLWDLIYCMTWLSGLFSFRRLLFIGSGFVLCFASRLRVCSVDGIGIWCLKQKFLMMFIFLRCRVLSDLRGSGIRVCIVMGVLLIILFM
jgi:hypothetical protein